METLSLQVRRALEEADLAAYCDLLDPNVTWGPPGSPSPPCRTREQVLAWYQRGKDDGTRARVAEVVVSGDRILIGLEVASLSAAGLIAAGRPAATRAGGEANRWQVLTVGGGRIVDIVGFERRSDAAARAGLAPG
ncbi:MAG: nuclear transport factor 2 family protein [Acidimicrobiales bacterium]|jgi:ketosteroid isomerase-like protein